MLLCKLLLGIESLNLLSVAHIELKAVRRSGALSAQVSARKEDKMPIDLSST